MSRLESLSRLRCFAFQGFVLINDIFVMIISRPCSCFGEALVLMGLRDGYFVRDYKSIDEGNKRKE